MRLLKGFSLSVNPGLNTLNVREENKVCTHNLQSVQARQVLPCQDIYFCWTPTYAVAVPVASLSCTRLYSTEANVNLAQQG
jgi:hypothetical protein